MLASLPVVGGWRAEEQGAGGGDLLRTLGEELGEEEEEEEDWGRMEVISVGPCLDQRVIARMEKTKAFLSIVPRAGFRGQVGLSTSIIMN